ncbi:Cap15 family CBASS effector [Scytonema sp. PRP1]|uniref:Cap15 family cyclic dinucleotide receptor domain-containing protein n=1 Tax=Scytonema sp. PRP1 TaxID=3120513 RepID=UPI00300DBE0C
MHTYATDAKDREWVLLWIAALAVVATLLLNYVLKVLNLQVPWWLDAPSVMGFYGLLYELFDEVIWALRIGPIRFSDIPNLRGTWVGVIRSSYQTGTETRGVIIYIRQTWSKISVQLETETSRSKSTMAAVYTENSSEPGLKYEYANEPGARSPETMQPHRGIVNLVLSPDRKTLKGDYFTSRSRQTYGEMVFQRVSYECLTRQEALQKASSFLASM